MKIVYQEGTGEIVEKKSRFIAYIFPIKTEEEALEYLNQIRKKHYDARHNCFCYVIGEKNEIMRSSDDGEPSGTAGRPMLEVVLANDIHDVLVVVTRYFGGTLLGTGGLVRAYTAATKEGLEHTVIIERKKGKQLVIHTDYNGIGKLQYVMKAHDITELSTDYSDAVVVTALSPLENLDGFVKEVTDFSGGKIQMEELDDLYYADIEGKIETWTC